MSTAVCILVAHFSGLLIGWFLCRIYWRRELDGNAIQKLTRFRVTGDEALEFYVDPKHGDDSNDGRTRKTAVKTIAGLRRVVLQAKT